MMRKKERGRGKIITRVERENETKRENLFTSAGQVEREGGVVRRPFRGARKRAEGRGAPLNVLKKRVNTRQLREHTSERERGAESGMLGRLSTRLAGGGAVVRKERKGKEIGRDERPMGGRAALM